MMPSSVKDPVIKAGWIRVLVFIIAFVGCIYLTGFILGLIAMWLGKTNLEGLFFPAITITTILSILLVITFRLLLDRKSLFSMGLGWKGREALLGFLLGPALLGAGASILYLSGHLHWIDSLIDTNDLLIGLGIMAMVAVGEELVFRGYILNNLLESLDKWMALGISSLLFALIHLDNDGVHAIALINLVLGGMLLGINYIYTRNLWFSIFFHFSWNFFQGPVLGFRVSGVGLQGILQQELSGSPLLTGDVFGFEGSIIDTALTVISLLLLWVAFERKYQSQ